MKVLFLTYGLAHYYTQLLSKLNAVPGVQIMAVVPAKTSRNVGAGVLLSTDGSTFKIIYLQERTLLKLFTTFIGLEDTIQREKPDIIVTLETFVYALMYFPRLSSILRDQQIKLILKSIPFGMPTRAQEEANVKSFHGFKNFVKSLIFIHIRTKSYNWVHAHLDYVDEAIKYFGDYGVPAAKIFVSRNSPDTDIFISTRKKLQAESPTLPPCPLRLIHVGRLVAWKKVDVLLKAFAAVLRVEPRSELLIIGSGPQDSFLKELAAKLGVAGQVSFLGDVHDPHKLGGYFLSSTIYVLAGMGGLSINDAMCFGLPVICSRCDGTEKFLVREGYNGRYYIEGDQQDLTGKILAMYSDKNQLKSMGEHSEQIIRNEVNIHTVIDIYVKSFRYVLEH